jgi:hypothetical protein
MTKLAMRRGEQPPSTGSLEVPTMEVDDHRAVREGNTRQEMALGGKSRRCNNFGSYGWYKRRGERVDFLPEFDPQRPSRMPGCCDATSPCDEVRELISCSLLFTFQRDD